MGGGGGGGFGRGGLLQTPIHMEKQLKNHQSNRETNPPPSRKRQKLKNQKWGSGETGGGEGKGKLKSEVIWLKH